MIKNTPALVSFIADWVKDYCKKFGITHVYCNTNSENDKSLYEILKLTGLYIIKYTHGEDESLENMHYFGDGPHVFASSIDYTYSKYTRQYSKPFESLMDIYPVKDLLYSEMRQLDSHFFGNGVPKEIIAQRKDWEMQEWAIHFEVSFPGPDGKGILTSDETPTKHPRWYALTLEQKQFVAALHQREKATRHKIIDRPYPKIPINMLCREEFPVPLL